MKSTKDLQKIIEGKYQLFLNSIPKNLNDLEKLKSATKPEHLKIIIPASLTAIGLITLLAMNILNPKVHQTPIPVVQEVEFPSANYHYGYLYSPKYQSLNVDIELYISLTSEASQKAYTALIDYKNKKDLTYKIIHLGQNPEWEIASRVFTTITSINENADLKPLFKLFISNPKPNPKEIALLLSDYLSENNISHADFDRGMNSIETLSKINKSIKQSIGAEIEFVPTMILYSKYYIYFGSFKSYDDSLRLVEALKAN